MQQIMPAARGGQNGMLVGVPERSQSVDDAIAGLFPDAQVFEDMHVGVFQGAGDVVEGGEVQGAREPMPAAQSAQHQVQHERVHDSRLHLAYTHQVQSTGGNTGVHRSSVFERCNVEAEVQLLPGQGLPGQGHSRYAQFNCHTMSGHAPAAGVAGQRMVSLQLNHGGVLTHSRQESTTHGSGMAAKGGDGTFSRTASGYSAVLGTGVAQGGDSTFSRTASGYSAVLSGETGMGIPISRTTSVHMVNPVPTAMVPGSSVFVRTASGGFARAPSGSLARASSGTSISRTSSTAVSQTSEWTDGGEDADMEGALPAGGARGENRTRAKQAPKRRPWSADEHARFVESLKRFGSRERAESGGRVTVGLGPGVAEIIAVVVGTRTVSQVRSHAQKYFLQLSRLASSGTNNGQAASTSSSQPPTTSQPTLPFKSEPAQGASTAQVKHDVTSSSSSSSMAQSSPAANYMPAAASTRGGGGGEGGG